MDKQNLLDNIEHIVGVGQSFEMLVTGFSMLPLLGRGCDRIVVRRVDAEESVLGRIAMFRTEQGRIIVHRVVAQNDGVVTLRGDGNILGCEQCRRSDIIGVVDSVIRQSGRVVSCTSRRWIFLEHLWLAQPLVVRRYVLAIMRRLNK